MRYLSAIEAITQFLFIPNNMPDKVDVCIVLGNDYVDTMMDVAAIFNKGICDKFILTGHSAKMDKEPECDRFFQKGLEFGIPAENMFLENRATNSYENLEFSKQIINEQLGGFDNCRKILFVAKAFVTRRVDMTAKKLYPDFIQAFYYPTVDNSENGKNIRADNWWKNEAATKRVMAEVERIGKYFLNGDLSIS